MSKAFKLFLAVAVVFGLAGFAAAGEKLGNFEVTDASGAKFTQENLKKNPKSMLVFVQAACGACRQEINAIKEEGEDITKKASLYIVIVDINGERAVDFFKKQETPGTFILDPDFKIGGLVGAVATPATIVVDKDLNVLKKDIGFNRGDFEKTLGTL